MEIRRCAYGSCGRLFETGNLRRRFCSEACRRAAQNEARRIARAEEREIRESARHMADPWARCDLDDWTAEDIWTNALLDPLPPGLS